MYIPKTHNNIPINLYLCSLLFGIFAFHDIFIPKLRKRYFLDNLIICNLY